MIELSIITTDWMQVLLCDAPVQAAAATSLLQYILEHAIENDTAHLHVQAQAVDTLLQGKTSSCLTAQTTRLKRKCSNICACICNLIVQLTRVQ